MTKQEMDDFKRAIVAFLKKEIEQTITTQFRKLTLETLTSAEVSKAEAARILGVTPKTIHNYVKSGRLKETKSGKISKESLVERIKVM